MEVVDMKSLKLAVVAISLVGVFGVGNVMALDTATLDVSATVIETCRFDSDGGTLAFGNLDALNPADVLAVAPDTNPYFTCSNKTVYTITDDSALNPLNNGFDDIVYTLGYTAGGTADGTSTELVVTGDILQAAYAGVSAGAYAAEVTFTINP
jgi:hypothetical protein